MILVHCIVLHCIVLYRIALTVVYNYIQLNRTTLNSLHSTCNLTRTCKFHKSETTHWSTCICHTLGNFTSHKPYTDLQVSVTRLKTSQVRNHTLIYRYLSHACKFHKSERKNNNPRACFEVKSSGHGIASAICGQALLDIWTGFWIWNRCMPVNSSHGDPRHGGVSSNNQTRTRMHARPHARPHTRTHTYEHTLSLTHSPKHSLCTRLNAKVNALMYVNVLVCTLLTKERTAESFWRLTALVLDFQKRLR